MKRSFLNQARPVLTGIMAGQTPAELIAESRHAEFDGATGIAISLEDLRPEYRNQEALKTVIDAVNLPFMFFFYRHDRQEQLDDAARQEVLLTAADAGASIIDVMGDLYNPSADEITSDQSAIDRQKTLIDKIHAKGVDVVISSHTSRALTSEQALEHLTQLEKRNADVVKLVTTVNSDTELAEAFKTTMLLKRELKVPFIHLCNGKFSRPHRFLCPALGVSIFFAVPRYEPRYAMGQPTVKAMRTVLDNLHWDINYI